MVLKAVSLIFNDSTSPFNKELIDYLGRNLETIILKCSIIFHFKIAKASELQELKDMGITRLPAMTIGKDHYIGVPNIVGELRNRLKLNTDQAAVKSDDEILRDFQMSSVLGNTKKDSDGKFVINDNDDEDRDKNELMAAFNKEISRRTGTMQTETKKTRHVSNDQNNLQTHNQPRNTQPVQHRDDNIEGDALQSFNNIRKTGSGEDAADDTMMEALLARMSSD
jgi:hypothetical protein